ncbi:hypothetical protein [Mycoplasma seminis]|uniref:Uncharacterized protein n=1 Tax=Mycoplasma seminis TaxID=512749 RepID=A0ABY9H9U8_9MOLU|nr:hypothetical protein [Mycoplasma seminis]WLP85191.1 hypothetical protein Q8852_02615 [Mycoplasma seminis]
MSKTKKTSAWAIAFYIYLGLFSALLILVSGVIIPWSIIVKDSGYKLPLVARVLLSIVYAFTIIIFAFTLAWNEKISIYRVANYFFLAGIVLTLFWIPSSKTVDSKMVIDWISFPFDVVLVFILCAIVYLVATFTLSKPLLDKLKTRFSKPKSFLEENETSEIKAEVANTSNPQTKK